MRRRFLPALSAALCFLLTLSLPAAARDGAPEYGFRVIRAIPHDVSSFTQGLALYDGVLYEGTGRYGQSKLRKLSPATGEVLAETDLPSQVFGEGVTVFKGLVYQLTWREKQAFVYDGKTLEKLRTFSIGFTGWGLTHDGGRLIATDGSADLIFLDPDTMVELYRVPVTDAGRPVSRLNELEYVNGEVFANVWQTDRIARIDPATGAVRGWVVLAGIAPAHPERNPADVLNGIAPAGKQGRFFVTGKCWPHIFEITLVPLR